MAGAVDLTPFGFTPTESLIYEVLLRGGPGTVEVAQHLLVL